MILDRQHDPKHIRNVRLRGHIGHGISVIRWLSGPPGPPHTCRSNFASPRTSEATPRVSRRIVFRK